jgi:RNA polymerase sigma-70 factor (ECF subfamily)
VRYLVRRDRDVDDIAQDALVAILRGLGGYRADGSLTSWADRIVVRTTFAWLRRARVEPPLFALGRDPSSDLEATHVAPDDYVMRRWAVGVLDALPQEQRHAVVLHYVLDLSVPEVALEVGVPLETVRSRLRLARIRLRARGLEVEQPRERHGRALAGPTGGAS